MTSTTDQVHLVDVRTAALPPCQRCGAAVLLSARYRHSWENRAGAAVTGFKETALCPTCDADDPAAAGLLALLGQVRHLDAAHLTALGELVLAWLEVIRHRTPDPTELAAEEALWRAGEL
ncbi:DUF6300 family protein [Streptomyces noursei]|uniref:DUF6300 family protein n=1 Tax=Streptomyces noursei TaxID=1971 RepID=UPI001675E3C4|nr:DUF6300 family protein [Streptomyces noursei]MCZ1013136.1 DUF6300 family protein [Streptomyces noursei]GGX27233.1 hypothetical protein GCM10010341_55870 [Streptomyces noursei]